MLTRLLSPTLCPSTTGLKNPRLFFSGSPELLTILESENSLREKPLPKTELSCLHLSSFQNLRLSIFGCFGSPELQFTLYKYLSITYCRPSRELRTKGKMSTKTDVVLPSYNLKSILWLRNNQVITHTQANLKLRWVEGRTKCCKTVWQVNLLRRLGDGASSLIRGP